MMGPIAGSPIAWQVGIFVALLAGALVVGVLAERVNLPYAVALVCAGLAVSFDRQAVPFDFGTSLLFFFLPALLFEAAWNLKLDALKRTWRAIAVLAVPGVLVTMLVMALFMMPAGLGWAGALVFGAIVSATDPVAVIAVFRRMPVPVDLQTIVEGESLFNDGVAAVFTAEMVAVALGTTFSLPALVEEALYAAGAGIAIGVACAYAVAQLLRGVQDAQMRTVGTVLVAYGSYILATLPHASGIFAAIAAGISLRAFTPRSAADETVEAFWGTVAFLANSLVFLMMGLAMRVDRFIGEPLLLLGALVGANVSRLVVSFGLPPLPEVRAGGLAWREIIAMAGMRGALAVALVLSLPAQVPHREQIVDSVFAVVLFTIIVQGLAIGPVVQRLWPKGEA